MQRTRITTGKKNSRSVRTVKGRINKRARKFVSVSDQRFQFVARATNDAVWDWNLVTNELWWNDGIKDLFGYSKDEIGPDITWWHEHLHPEDRKRVIAGLDSFLGNGQESWSDEYRYRRADGTYAYAFDRGYVMRDRKGRPVRMIGAMVDITERKLSEEALRESQERLQAILNHSPSMIFLKDTAGRYIHCNPPFEKICARSQNQILGKTDWDLFPAEEASIFTANDRKVLEAGRPMNFEESLVHSDGPHISLVSKFPLRDAQGQIYALGGIVTDITERKRAEEALVMRNRELQTLRDIGQTILDTSDFKSALDRILENALRVASFDMGIIRLLDPHTGLLEAVVSLGVYDLNNIKTKIARDGHPEMGLVLMEALKSNGAVVAENLSQIGGLRGFRRREGVQSAVVVPVRSGQQMLGTIQFGSRTARKFNAGEIRLLETFGNQLGVAIQKFRFYEEIQRNLERIGALHEINLAITSTLDLHEILNVLLEQISLVFRLPSAMTARLLDRNGELATTACRNLDRKEWELAVRKTAGAWSGIVLASKTPVMIPNLWSDPRTAQLEFFRAHNLVSYLGLPLIVKDKILGCVGIYTTTEHEFSPAEVEFLTTIVGQAAVAIQNAQMHEELVKANKVKTEFLNIISHELRTPLNVIMGYSAMIENGLLGDVNADQQSALGKVIAQSNHLTKMINNILSVTALEAGSSEMDLGEVDLESLLSDLKANFQALPAKNLTLSWNYPPDLPRINTDSLKLKTILQILVSNAVKFTENGTVTISTRSCPDSRTVEFEVADTGTGIPKNMLPFIFDKFRQVDSSETRLHEGMGIGLYIAKGFTELLGGTIDVKSDLGIGSCFTVRIPADRSVRLGAGKSAQKYDQ